MTDLGEESDNDLFITPDIIIPLPEAKDYVERKEIKRREEKQPSSIRSSFSLEKGDFDIPVLEEMLSATLARQSDLTPRFGRVSDFMLTAIRAL
ncbi:MAG: hypothetical protein ACRD9R_04770 [Pyrinomonadaceae bacterium]